MRLNAINLGINSLNVVRGGGGAGVFNPAVLWPLGATSPGMWTDPPYTASLFSTSAGTTAISAIGTVLDTDNPVGLALDRKGAFALGPEVVVNGDFATDTVWNKGAGWSIGGGLASGVTAASLNQTGVLTVNKRYQATVVVSSYSAGPLYVGSLGALATLPTGTGTKVVYFVADATTLYLAGLGAFTGSVDSVSVKEILGIHLSQATATSRPVASARKNLLVGTAALATQSVTVIAAQCVLSFTGTGTVTLSGTSTAGPLIGTGAADRVSLTFTPTAGSLTLTVSGSVTLAQLEYRA